MLISTQFTTIAGNAYADDLFTATVENCARTAEANALHHQSEEAYRLAIANELEAVAMRLKASNGRQPTWVYGLFDLAMEHADPL